MVLDNMGDILPMDPSVLRVLRIFRVFRILRAFRVFKAARGLQVFMCTDDNVQAFVCKKYLCAHRAQKASTRGWKELLWSPLRASYC
jgi:ADP-ribosylglycohydrolase